MMCSPGPRSKFLMFRDLGAGLFGNHLCLWKTEEELIRAVAEGFHGTVSLRVAGKVANYPSRHYVSLEDAFEERKILSSAYSCPVWFSESPPDEHLFIQGEFCEMDHGEALEWSTVKRPMREALAKERHAAFGPQARLILRQVLNRPSYDDILMLGELYPGAVIEFSAYHVLVGRIPGRNYVCWECRRY